MSLRGKKVVIVGGTSGIGFAVAEGALAEHAEVVVASSNAANVDAAVKRLGEGVKGFPVDVTSEASVEAFFKGLGPIDHLVFTAGDWGDRGNAAIGEVDIDRAMAAMFSVRFWGAVRAVKHAQKHLATNGSVTITDGTVAHRPRKGAPLSTAMAGAVEHLARGLAMDMAPIRVNAVCPAMIRTDVWNSIPEDGREERIKRMTAHQPLPRIGEPAEVAEAYLYLMKAGYTTGQVLLVDGGSSLV
jgi:NAD(P)-dependent dehydrogenase (short-subunit alcohol dehydrogenase family)